MLEAGTLNRRVRIERRDQTQDDLGQPVDTWVEVATAWCNVRMLTGKETLAADADVASATASIRIRYRTDITNVMRAVVDGVIFNILAPLPDLASREYTDLACSAFANNG
ncbi:phage head closure protein [Paraburkholderia atlantica]|uniref:phage head closure protein n=1 Tax=Paraburkholderia atlantica TaxID=2654982 RepID=UPI00035E425D|nr:phage head closure protein [Paraburkholderia atlantica]